MREGPIRSVLVAYGMLAVAGIAGAYSFLRRPGKIALSAAIWLGIPVACFVFLIWPSLQAPPIRGGDENLRFTIAPLTGDLAARINVNYSSTVYPAGSLWVDSPDSDLLVETVHVWWYATEQTAGSSTTETGVYADGANGGEDWACQSDNPPGNEGDPDEYYHLADYPNRVPAEDEYVHGANVPPHTSALIQVAPRTKTTYELDTAGIPSPTTQPTPQPAPTPSRLPPVTIDVHIGVPDPQEHQPAIIVPSTLPIATTDQYDIYCQREKPLNSASDARQLISVPEITVAHSGFPASVDAEASAHFTSNWSIVSPNPDNNGGTVDSSTPGLVWFTFHTPLPPSNETRSSSTMFGASFVVSNPDAQGTVSFMQQMGFLILGAWIAMGIGVIPHGLLTKPWADKKPRSRGR